MVNVKLYAEGGGEGALLDTLFRKAWTEFFKAAGLEGKMPRPVRGRGRSQTFDLFKTAVNNARPGELPLLLVDSEGPINSSLSVWENLKNSDGWDQPMGTSDSQAFLMVQVMETWFLADRTMLANYFGQHFSEANLPAWADLEAVPKASVLRALDASTARCGKKKYGKGKISFELLAQVDPEKVGSACPNAKTFLETLRKI